MIFHSWYSFHQMWLTFWGKKYRVKEKTLFFFFFQVLQKNQMPEKEANGKKKYPFALDSSSLDTVHPQFPLTKTMSMRIEGTQ